MTTGHEENLKFPTGAFFPESVKTRNLTLLRATEFLMKQRKYFIIFLFFDDFVCFMTQFIMTRLCFCFSRENLSTEEASSPLVKRLVGCFINWVEGIKFHSEISVVPFERNCISRTKASFYFVYYDSSCSNFLRTTCTHWILQK